MDTIIAFFIGLMIGAIYGLMVAAFLSMGDDDD